MSKVCLLLIVIFVFIACENKKTFPSDRDAGVSDSEQKDEDGDFRNDDIANETDIDTDILNDLDSDVNDDEQMISGLVFGTLVINPSGNIPLSAEIEVDTKGVSKVTVSIK
ncbi:MAG TPA: hypothetical protein PKG52_13205, partial [bacterium]|nr:hypothetical protein [bacterium]